MSKVIGLLGLCVHASRLSESKVPEKRDTITTYLYVHVSSTGLKGNHTSILILDSPRLLPL